jgi:hypothetical protein
MIRRFLAKNSHAKLLVAAFTICSLPVFAVAKQQSPRPNADTCRQYTKPTIRMNAGETGQTVKLDDLIDKKDQFYGKIVTVEGEMHRIFTDRVFTIEDDDLLKDDDVLIISDVPRAQAVVALEKSIEPGKNVRVTGFVHKYDQQELECLYGPLQTESRDGHSFTKSPVLIVQKVQAAAAEAPSRTTAPEQRAAVEPQSPAPATAAPSAEPALPRTASGLPLLGLLGLASVFTALAIRVFHS